MAKLKWDRTSGRGMHCGNLTGCFHYGKSSGTNRTFLTVQIVNMTQGRFKNGFRFVILHVKKNNMIYKLAVADKIIIKQLHIGAKIDCVGKPTGQKILILKEITFI